jgi:riboflavin kinase/FMN adenylyltransferase
MKLIRHPGSDSFASRGSIAALGSFDGFHVGHLKVVRRAVDLARRDELLPAAVALHRAPSASARQAEGALTTLRQLLELLDEAGVELVVLVTRSDVSDSSIAGQLSDSLRLRAVIAAGGSDDEGAQLASRARQLGVAVEIETPLVVDGAEVSRAAVRNAVRGGDLALLERLLGRKYAICGRVVHGHHRGKGLGIPTANLRPRGMELPPDGVYAVWASVSGRKLAGVANVGRKPTFGDLDRTIETHILDFDETLYGRLLRVEFAERLRGEVRFPNVEALLEQIRSDIAQTRLVLASR